MCAPLRLAPRALQVMQRHHATGLNIVYDYEQRDSRKSILDCVRDCYTK